MRILDRAGRQDDVTVAARTAERATDIALPADRPQVVVGGVLPAGADTAIAPPRVRHGARRRVVVIEITRAHADNEASGSESSRDLQFPRRSGTPQPAVPANRTPHDSSYRGPRVRTAITPPNASDPVRDRTRTTRDFDGASDTGIEERRVCTSAPLRRAPAAVDENEGAPATQAANRGDGRFDLPRSRSPPVQRRVPGSRSKGDASRDHGSSAESSMPLARHQSSARHQ